MCQFACLLNELFYKFGADNCNSVITTVDVSARVQKNGNPSQEDQNFSYRELVGVVTYCLSTPTCPDIAFAGMGRFGATSGQVRSGHLEAFLLVFKTFSDVGSC